MTKCLFLRKKRNKRNESRATYISAVVLFRDSLFSPPNLSSQKNLILKMLCSVLL